MAKHPPPLFDDDLGRARAICRGDERAFRVFYDEAFPRLYRFALRHCGDAALAEEVTQESLVMALETLSRYRGDASLLSWVFGIARHRLLRRHGAEARLLRFEDEAGLESALAALLPEAREEPAQRLAREQATERVHSVLDRLPPLYAECLEGKYVLGLSVRELGERLGRSEKAIESTLSRARQAFRDAFLAGLAAENCR